MILVGFFISSTMALACKDTPCRDCFDRTDCVFCDVTFPGTNICKDKADCSGLFAEPFAASKKNEVCDDPCEKHDCSACFSQSGCVWCDRFLESSTCSLAANCKGQTDTIVGNIMKACGDPCSYLDCNACFESPTKCKMCKGTLGIGTKCRSLTDECTAIAKTEQTATCGDTDPCSVNNADCTKCMSQSGCQVCGFGADQKCLSLKMKDGTAKMCDGTQRRQTCGDCRSFGCDDCVKNPDCTFCQVGIGALSLDGSCQNGAGCSNILASKITACDKQAPPSSSSPSPSDPCSGRSCSTCIADAKCKWCETKGIGGYGSCSSSCAIYQTAQTDASMCDACAHLTCSDCKSNAQCAWCGPRLLPLAHCGKGICDNTVTRVNKTCGEDNTDPMSGLPKNVSSATTGSNKPTLSGQTTNSNNMSGVTAVTLSPSGATQCIVDMLLLVSLTILAIIIIN